MAANRHPCHILCERFEALLAANVILAGRMLAAKRSPSAASRRARRHGRCTPARGSNSKQLRGVKGKPNNRGAEHRKRPVGRRVTQPLQEHTGAISPLPGNRDMAKLVKGALKPSDKKSDDGPNQTKYDPGNLVLALPI
jgi:hypothetical protein